ncbi:MAG: hypothetical protein ACI3Y5_08645 [Prevotella sp.]
MKKVLFTLAMMLTTLTASSMSYEQAREQALFLTDKMAYELDLTEEQYEAAYEVNLDYLMSITTASDVYSDYWTRRNLDLSYILFDWQYRTFCGLEYFYRPIYWGAGAWHFRIFGYYPHTHFYFGRPACFYSYHGAHAWHINGGRSWYRDRHFARHDYGMRGGWDRGGYRKMSQGWHSNDGHSRGFDRNSRPQGYRDNSGRGTVGGNHGTISRNNDGSVRRDNVSGRGNLNTTRRTYDMPRGTSTNSGISGRRTYGGHTDASRPSSTRQTVTEGSRDENRTYTPSRSFSGNGTGSSTGTRRPSNSFNRTFGSSSSSSSSRPSRSFSGSSSSRSSSSYSGSGSSRSFSSGSSSSRSVSGGGSSSHSGGHSGGGSGHFGGGRR